MIATETTPALKDWLSTVFYGNLDTGEWSLKTLADGPLAVPAHARYSYKWTKVRSRGATALTSGTIDAQIDQALKTGAPVKSLRPSSRPNPATG